MDDQELNETTEELSEEEYSELGKSEIEKLTSEEIQKDEEVEDEKTDEEHEEKLEESKEETKVSEESEEGEKGKTEEEPDPVEIMHRQVRTARKAERDARKETAKLNQRIKELEIEGLKIKAESKKPLTPDQLEELKGVDPDAYVEYKLRQAEFENAQNEIRTRQEQLEYEKAQNLAKEFYGDVTDFVAKITGTPGEDLSIDPTTWPDEMQNFYKSPEYAELAKVIDTRIQKTGRYPDAEEIDLEYIRQNKDKILRKAEAVGQAKGAEDVTQKIKDAARKTSPLTGRTETRNEDVEKEFENATPEEIESWGKTKLAEYEKWAKSKEAA